MNLKNITILLIFTTLKINAQQTYGGVPYSILVNTTNSSLSSYRSVAQNVPVANLPTYNYLALKLSADSIADSCSTCGYKYYGKAISQNVNLITMGIYQLIDSTKVYRYKFYSSTANALQFYFSKFKIPEGGSLFFYNSSKTQFFGALNDNNNPVDTTTNIVMATMPLLGGDWIMEYNEPLSASFNAQIVINNVVHVFNNLKTTNSSSASNNCQIDVDCLLGYGWDDEKKSAVMISYLNNYNLFASICSGNLINQTDNGERLFVLSAGHCFLTPTGSIKIQLGSLHFYYRYEKNGCYNDGNTSVPNNLKSSYGAVIRRIKYDVSDFDYSLFELTNVSKETLRKFGICYAGWDNSSTLSPLSKPFTMIHHADGQEKKISQTINQDLESIQYLPDPITSPNAGFYRVYWDQGTSMHGSSGAGLFDSNHRLIGILNGGDTNCTNGVYNGVPDRFSKFSKSYFEGTGFANYLDPQNSNATICNAFCPVDVSADPTANSYDGTVQFDINGHQTNGGKLIQVCANNVILSPTSLTNKPWNFHMSEQKRLCNNISNANKAAQNKQTCVLAICRCHSIFMQLFISIQECDYNYNLTGSEYSEWFYFYDGNINTRDEENISNIDLNSYAPQGFHMQDGKYYKIKVATVNTAPDPDQYFEYSAFVKTFSNDLTISNENIIHNELAVNNIFIDNSTTPITTPPVKVVAGNSIKISSTSKLNSGRYYISSLNCGTIGNFKTNNTNSEITQNDLPIKNLTPVKENNNVKLKSETGLVFIYPNPSNNNFKVKLNLIEASSVSLKLIDLNGKEIISSLNFTNQNGNVEYTLNASNLIAGMYILKAKINQKTFNFKVIKTNNDN